MARAPATAKKKKIVRERKQLNIALTQLATAFPVARKLLAKLLRDLLILLHKPQYHYEPGFH